MANNALNNAKKAVRIGKERGEKNFRYIVSFRSLVDDDMSFVIFNDYEKAVEYVLQEYRNCDYPEEAIEDCRNALQEQDIWKSTRSEEIVRIDTANFGD